MASKAIAYIGEIAPETDRTNDQIRTLVDEDTGIVTHVSARALGCTLQSDSGEIPFAFEVSGTDEQDLEAVEELLVSA
jgi:hypothetical protein